MAPRSRWSAAAGNLRTAAGTKSWGPRTDRAGRERPLLLGSLSPWVGLKEAGLKEALFQLVGESGFLVDEKPRGY